MKDNGEEEEEGKKRRKGGIEDEDLEKELEEDDVREQPGARARLVDNEVMIDGEAKGVEDCVVSDKDKVPDDPEANFEVRPPKIARKPVLPTKAEIDEHFPLHPHYRSWCKHCVAGKARSSPHLHKDREQDEKYGVTWHADYTFMGGSTTMRPKMGCNQLQ